MDPQLLCCPKGVRGAAQLLSAPVCHHMHIIIQEDRLVTDQNIIPGDPLHHLPVCDLAVDQGVAQGILPVMEHLLIAFDHILNGPVSDHMGHHLNPRRIRQTAELVHLFLCDTFHSAVSRVVLIFFPHGRRPSAQGTILKKL